MRKNKASMSQDRENTKSSAGKFLLSYFSLVLAFYLIEVLAFLLLKPVEGWPLLFGLMYALFFAGIIVALPQIPGRILFGICYFLILAWTLSQCGYYRVFHKLMWLSSISFAGEGATFIGDVLTSFPLLLWVGGAVLVALGVLICIKFPRLQRDFGIRIPFLLVSAISVVTMFLLPEAVFIRDQEVWGTRSEFGQSSSYRARYETMYDARNVYDLCGIYQTTVRDVWKNELYPLTPAFRKEVKNQRKTIDAYFEARGAHTPNEMTGILEGKNVVLVLMESMDDWMITQQDTPTLYQMMDEGINFTEFYTPGYGTVRTFNSEFCMNTGIYLPTTGTLVFDYVTNNYSQSLANQMNELGYTSEVFHYNTPEFYSRGVFSPAMGFNSYVCYQNYEQDKNALYDDCLLFDDPNLSEIFFREGSTFNFVITRSAHLSYVYNEVLSYYALKQYPQYRGMYGSQEEDCARLKAKLVDDMFARLVKELESRGQLENTVIIGITDHYTYGYKNTDELLALSGVEHELLLEKTPCFIWSPDCPDVDVTKAVNTADFLPTVLNLLGVESAYNYLGQDAFDPNYDGCVIFPDGSWITQGVICKMEQGTPLILKNKDQVELSEAFYEEMNLMCNEYIGISNLLLTSNYYETN